MTIKTKIISGVITALLLTSSAVAITSNHKPVSSTASETSVDVVKDTPPAPEPPADTVPPAPAPTETPSASVKATTKGSYVIQPTPEAPAVTGSETTGVDATQQPVPEPAQCDPPQYGGAVNVCVQHATN